MTRKQKSRVKRILHAFGRGDIGIARALYEIGEEFELDDKKISGIIIDRLLKDISENKDNPEPMAHAICRGDIYKTRKEEKYGYK